MEKQNLKKPLKQMGETPDYEGPEKAMQPGKSASELKQMPGGGTQGHPNKAKQTAGDMRFIE
jgi:hypothetical protein